MLKIRRPLGRLIFNMGIAIPGKTVFLIETAPRGPFHNSFSIVFQIWWKFHSALIQFINSEVITFELHTWHNSCADMACAKFCSDMVPYNAVTLKPIFHGIWITMEKSFVKQVPEIYKTSSWWPDDTNSQGFVLIHNLMVCSALLLKCALCTVHYIIHSWEPPFVVTLLFLVNIGDLYFSVYAAIKIHQILLKKLHLITLDINTVTHPW